MTAFLSPSLLGSQLVGHDEEHAGDVVAEISVPVGDILETGSSNRTEVPQSELEVSDAPVGHVQGPRIKHVCRRAAVALGRPATFPSRRELTLSALPLQEKERLLEEERPGTYY